MDKVVYIGALGGLNYFLHCHLTRIVSVLDVLSNGAVKQQRFLGDNANLVTHPLQVQTFDICAIKKLQ